MALLDTSARPTYQRIARKALRLHELGLTDTAITRSLGVTDKTVAKAIRWLQQVQSRPDEGVDSTQGSTELAETLLRGAENPRARAQRGA